MHTEVENNIWNVDQSLTLSSHYEVLELLLVKNKTYNGRLGDFDNPKALKRKSVVSHPVREINPWGNSTL